MSAIAGRPGIPVIDGHNDLPWARREHHSSRVDGLGGLVPDLHTDLPRLAAGGVGGQFWSTWVDPELPGAQQVTATLEQIDFVHRLVAAYPDRLAFARTAADARAAIASGRIASLLGVEGGAQLDGSLGVLRQYARLGVRYLTLTWSRTTDWADSATDEPRHGGLSPFGRDVVRELNRVGVLVDLAHVAPTTMHDALDVSTRPVIVSHSGAAALCRHPRNVPDDVIARIGAGGGVVMVAFVPSFLTEARRAWVAGGEHGPAPVVGIADVADHIEHVRAVAGVHAVGIGADYDGTDAMPTGLSDVSGYPLLLDELRSRGWGDDELAALAHGNILRVLEAADADHLAFLDGTAPLESPAARVPGSARRVARPRVLVVVNAPASGPRRLASWLTEDGIDLDVRRGADGLPADLSEYDGLVMLGGGLMPDDDEDAPWLRTERALVAQAIAHDAPTLGICLGAQIIAHVANGTVRASFGPKERGATVIVPSAAGRVDAVMGAAGAFGSPNSLGWGAPMIENHQDMITILPPHAVLLASSAEVEIQAFRLGAHVRGVQFHPEVAAEDLLAWEEPTDAAPGDASVAELVRAARAVDEENTRASRALVAAFAAEVRAVREERSAAASSAPASTIAVES